MKSRIVPGRAASVQEAVDRLAEEITRACRETAPQPGLRRLEAEIESTDALSWLSAQPDVPKVYWRDRENETELAGVLDNEPPTWVTEIARGYDRLARYTERVQQHAGVFGRPRTERPGDS